LRQIGDQGTPPPQGRPRWIGRAMARELGASKATKATGIYWNEADANQKSGDSVAR